MRVAYFEKERRELVGLNYAEPVRSPLSAASPEALGYSHYFAELIDEWAADADADERLFRLACSALDALVGGTPVDALARYFECWLLRLQGVYPPDLVALARRAGVSSTATRQVAPREVASLGASRPRAARDRAETSEADSVAPRKGAAVGSRDERAAATRNVTFQDLILKLQQFWASQGCLIQQPLDLEVGAGTSHPETLLRVLGPTPWNVAYVQPSRRPDDGRFGQNPNRLFKHHQMQVILKPSPDEVQQIYLDSLEACGINPRQHDIRFEEDNWESPTLGAWGIGWQVMLDGTEITQFTYFQQVGGIDLAPISCEITYGLERIAMFLQKVDNVFDLEWGGGEKYGEVRLREEVEQSKYAFNQDTGIDRERLLRRSTAISSTRTTSLASELLKGGLMLPALEHCLKCSHLFNLLDSSGSVGVTERMAYILRVRQLALAICKAYVGNEESAASRRSGTEERAASNGSRTAPRNRHRRDPGQLAARADDAARHGARGEAEGSAAADRRADRDLQHAAPPDRARRQDRRAADRSRRAGDRAAGLGGIRRGRQADAGRRRLRKKQGVDRGSDRARQDAEGRIHRRAQASARQGRGRCAARGADRRAARHVVSEADAMGRDARRRQGRAAVRPADSLDPVSLRRPRRAVHDRAARRSRRARACRRSAPARSPTAIAS